MDLTPEAIQQIEKEVNDSIANQGDLVPTDISAASLCANKDLILGFLETLVGLIPGVIGKLAGQGILVAAKAWFKNRGC